MQRSWEARFFILYEIALSTCDHVLFRQALADLMSLGEQKCRFNC